jgi:hypothetical protein
LHFSCRRIRLKHPPVAVAKVAQYFLCSYWVVDMVVVILAVGAKQLWCHEK